MEKHTGNTIAHMNMIQGVITRLETNCFTLKAMAMTIAAALLAFLGSIENPNWIYPAAVSLPILVFWAMDAKYLRLGRLFRHLFSSVRKNECTDPFTMNIADFTKQEQSTIRIMFSWSVSLFYISILFAFLFSMIFFITSDSNLNNSQNKEKSSSTQVSISMTTDKEYKNGKENIH